MYVICVYIYIYIYTWCYYSFCVFILLFVNDIVMFGLQSPKVVGGSDRNRNVVAPIKPKRFRSEKLSPARVFGP